MGTNVTVTIKGWTPFQDYVIFEAIYFRGKEGMAQNLLLR
jgi:hypothetical protein